MKQHQYRITVEKTADANGKVVPDQPALQFEAGNHDDIVSVVDRLRQRGDFNDATAAALGVGIKLFGEVMLENRNHPLFVPFMPHFGQFMKALKSGSKVS